MMLNKLIWGIWFYLWNLFIALDIVVNTVLLGDPNETISSRAARAMKRDKPLWARFVCSVTNLIDPNHCPKAIEPDEGSDSWFSRMRRKFGDKAAMP